MAQLSSWSSHYKPQDVSERFYTKLITAQINGLKLVGVACAPIHTDLVAKDSAMVCVTFSGAENHSIINGKDYHYRPTEAAVYGPECRADADKLCDSARPQVKWANE